MELFFNPNEQLSPLQTQMFWVRIKNDMTQEDFDAHWRLISRYRRRYRHGRNQQIALINYYANLNL